MEDLKNEILEMILRDCAYTGGESWYLAEYAKQTGLNRDDLEYAADQLRRAGLIELTKFVPGRGQGFMITDFGIEMLRSSKHMGRLRTMGVAGLPAPRPAHAPAGGGGYPDRGHPERAPGPRDRSGVKDMPEGVREVPTKEAHEFAPTVSKEFQGKGDGGPQSKNKVLAALSSNKAPIITIGLVLLGLLNFLYGMQVSMGEAHGFTLRDYLMGRIPSEIYFQLGAMDQNLVVKQGEWFRLLTSAFVFQGFIHVAFNMMALFSSGRQMEKIWGGWRMFLLFVLCTLGSSCARLITVPDSPHMGAFGTVCGFLGSTLMWAMMARSSLPSELFWGLIRSTIFSGLFIGILCFIWPFAIWGYAVGAITGAVVTIPLYFTRFSRGALPVTFGFVGVALITFFGLGYFWYHYQPKTAIERARVYYGPEIQKADDEAYKLNKELDKGYLSQVVDERPFKAEEAKKWHEKIDAMLETLKDTERKVKKGYTAADEEVTKIEKVLKQAQDQENERSTDKLKEKLAKARMLRRAFTIARERFKDWKKYFEVVRGFVKEDGTLDVSEWERFRSIRRKIHNAGAWDGSLLREQE